MKRLLKCMMFFVLLLNNMPLWSHKPMIVESNGMDLWCETFGERHQSPVLLIAGAGTQCTMWPEGFCEALAQKDHFVIRYDHRDTGLSTHVNYQETPYTVMDLTQDSLGVLNAYQVQKAHIVGLSMGGQIAQFIGAFFPERAATLTLMATSTSFEPAWNAFDPSFPNHSSLSPPQEMYVKAANDYLYKFPQASCSERLELFKNFWRSMNVDDHFDDAYDTQSAQQFFERDPQACPASNHTFAMKTEATIKAHREAPQQIKIPTLVIQGGADPLFGSDHGEALHRTITGSRLFIAPHMGHVIPSHNHADLVQELSLFMAAHEECIQATS